MVTRRRQTRTQQRKKNPPKRQRRRKAPTSLKEKLLTTGIWGFGVANVILIISLASNFFVSPNEQANTAVPHPQKKVVKNQDITVEVLNACGVQGLAYEVTQYLREKHFDVVEFGNYAGGFDLDKTFVFDRVSLDNEYATRIGKALGVASRQIKPQLDNSKQLMVTVLIGKDFKTLKMYKSMRKAN